MVRKIYKLLYIIFWIGMLTASQDTLSSLDRKRRLEENHLETDTSKQLRPDNTTGHMDPSIQVCNEAMNPLGTATNSLMGESSSSKTYTGNVAGNDDIIIIDDEVNTSKAIEILRELGYTKDENIFNDFEFVRMLKEYLEKLDREQDGEGVNEVIGILSNYKSGLKLLCSMIGDSNLHFVSTMIYALIYDPNPYNYTNGVFLHMLLCPPWTNLTADSIRTRFKMGFLNLLTTNQIVRVISSLLKNELSIKNEERIELVEVVFGHIDFASELDFSMDQVSIIIMAILNSEVPEVFEQVFLTWKMWCTFGIEQQEAIFNSYCSSVAKGKIYKRETLVMLYLFVLNKDEPNFEHWKVIKEDIKLKYGKGLGHRQKLSFSEIIANPRHHDDDIKWIVNTFDNWLLDLPEELKTLNTFNFKNFTKAEFYSHEKTSYYYGMRYKIHVCYVFSKFNYDNVNCKKPYNSNSALLNELYFDIRNVKGVFQIFEDAKDNRVCGSQTPVFVINLKDKVELKNIFGALRQVVQSKKYNHGVFVEVILMIRRHVSSDWAFYLFLFLLTKEDILKDASKNPHWIEHKESVKKTRCGIYCFNEDIENSFMYNLCGESSKRRSRIRSSESDYLKEIYDLLCLIDKNDEMYRLRHLFQRFFFHPKFKRFTRDGGNNYISGLKATSMLTTKEDFTQFARDLILNDYYGPTMYGNYDFVLELEDLENMTLFDEVTETPKCDKIDIYRMREKAILGHYYLQ